METLLLQSESKKDIKLFVDLAQKIGLKTKLITNDNLEDIGLANAMDKGRTGEFIDKNSYLRKLKAK